MTILSLNEAAKAAHKSKAALLEQIRSGKLSAYQDPVTKRWQIDTSELFRVNEPSNPSLKPVEESVSEPLETAKTGSEQALLERERAILIETISDLRQRLDTAQLHNEKLTAQLSTFLITYQPRNTAPAAGNKKLWALVSFSVTLAFYSIYKLLLK